MPRHKSDGSWEQRQAERARAKQAQSAQSSQDQNVKPASAFSMGVSSLKMTT